VHLDALTDAALEVIAEHVPKKSSPMSFTLRFVLGGDVARHDEADSAFGGSGSARYVLNIVAAAPTREQLEADREWARNFWSDLVPHATGIGSYVNFMTDFEPERIAAAYGAEKLERLRRVKATYDPENVFRHNANIAPAMA
jgi:Berberine and berberine like